MKILAVHILSIQLLLTQSIALGESQPAEPGGDEVKLKNVELTSSGALNGQFVTAAGLSVSDAEIIVQIGKDQHRVTCDQRGRFELPNIRGGRCVIYAGQEIFACQLWAHGTAPPDAISSIAVVASADSEIRGNAFWPPPYIPVPAKLAAISAKQAAFAGLAVAGATVGIIAIADDNNDDAS